MQRSGRQVPIQQKNCETYLCGAFLAVSENALNCHYSCLVAARGDELQCFGSDSCNGGGTCPHVAVYLSTEAHRISTLKWVKGPEKTWMFTAHGILQRCDQCDTRHAEAETRIPYFIREDGVQEHSVLVVSCDSDCPAISLMNADLRGHKIVHRVSDQYIYLDALDSQLNSVKIHPSFVTRCFITGGCDFNPYLKHVPQCTFARVAVNHGTWLCALIEEQRVDDTSCSENMSTSVTILLICLSFYEHIKRTGGSSQKVISHPPPLPSSSDPCFIENLRLWTANYRIWQHESIFAQSLHHLLPYDDAMQYHHRRVMWISKYWACATRTSCNDESESNVNLEQYGFHSDGTPILDCAAEVKRRSLMMADDTHRCGCFKGCSRGCSCQRKGKETPCLLCGCCYARNQVDPPLRKKKPPEQCNNPFNQGDGWLSIRRNRLAHTTSPSIQPTAPQRRSVPTDLGQSTTDRNNSNQDHGSNIESRGDNYGTALHSSLEMYWNNRGSATGDDPSSSTTPVQNVNESPRDGDTHFDEIDTLRQCGNDWMVSVIDDYINIDSADDCNISEQEQHPNHFTSTTSGTSEYYNVMDNVLGDPENALSLEDLSFITNNVD